MKKFLFAASICILSIPALSFAGERTLPPGSENATTVSPEDLSLTQGALILAYRSSRNNLVGTTEEEDYMFDISPNAYSTSAACRTYFLSREICPGCHTYGYFFSANGTETIDTSVEYLTSCPL